MCVRERNAGVLYRLPWSVVFNMALAASVLGAARGFIDAWIEQTMPRKLASAVCARCVWSDVVANDNASW